jgi:hypothetical protein
MSYQGAVHDKSHSAGMSSQDNGFHSGTINNLDLLKQLHNLSVGVPNLGEICMCRLSICVRESCNVHGRACLQMKCIITVN